MKPYIIIILSLISIVNGQAQQNGQKPDKAVEKLINKGLHAYDKAEYREAELDFRKALAKDPVNAVASYNLGLTQTELDKNLEAAHYFEKAAKQADDSMLKSKAYFNQGNVWYNKKKYDKAVEAYKNALRQNPSDEEARYNLALAQQKLKQQQKKNKQNQKKNNKNKQNKQNKNQQNKDQKNKKDQNKQGQNKKDQQKNQNGQDKKDQNKQNKKDQNKKSKGDKKKDQNQQNKQDKNQKNQGKQDQQKQKQQGGQKGQKQQEKQGQKRKAQLTPQQVKQILVALKNKEQKTQKKIKAKVLKGSGKKRKQDKDW